MLVQNVINGFNVQALVNDSASTVITTSAATVSVLVLSTYQEMISARNATDAHAHDYVVNDVWLLPTPLASAHCARSLHTTRNAWCFQFVCRSISVCLSYHQQSSSPPYSQQPTAPRQTRPPLFSAVCSLITSCNCHYCLRIISTRRHVPGGFCVKRVPPQTWRVSLRWIRGQLAQPPRNISVKI
jgi:hypothetical protein